MRKQAVTLIELLIAIALLSVITIAFSSINLFSYHHTVSAARRTDLQNDVSFAIAHMSKYVQQGVGDMHTNPPLIRHSSSGVNDGFSVRVDLKQPTPTPSILDDDLWIHYYLDANDGYLKFSCTKINSTNSPPCPADEILSRRILPGVFYGLMPAHPVDEGGFFIDFTDTAGNPTAVEVEVGLAARYNNNLSEGIDNPQVEIKNRLYTHSSSNR